MRCTTSTTSLSEHEHDISINMQAHKIFMLSEQKIVMEIYYRIIVIVWHVYKSSLLLNTSLCIRTHVGTRYGVHSRCKLKLQEETEKRRVFVHKTTRLIRNSSVEGVCIDTEVDISSSNLMETCLIPFAICK